MKSILLLTLVLFVSASFAQNHKTSILQDSLIGVWQEDSNLLAAGLADNYQFFKDDSFKFNFNSMSCGLRRLWSILGSYKLLKDELILTVTSTYESVGGNIEEAGTEEGENGFQIIGDRMEFIKQDKPSVLHFVLGKNDNSEHSIEINGRKFYKLSNDPNAFK